LRLSLVSSALSANLYVSLGRDALPTFDEVDLRSVRCSSKASHARLDTQRLILAVLLARDAVREKATLASRTKNSGIPVVVLQHHLSSRTRFRIALTR
jgi:hypothetical protein